MMAELLLPNWVNIVMPNYQFNKLGIDSYDIVGSIENSPVTRAYVQLNIFYETRTFPYSYAIALDELAIEQNLCSAKQIQGINESDMTRVWKFQQWKRILELFGMGVISETFWDFQKNNPEYITSAISKIIDPWTGMNGNWETVEPPLPIPHKLFKNNLAIFVYSQNNQSYHLWISDINIYTLV